MCATCRTEFRGAGIELNQKPTDSARRSRNQGGAGFQPASDRQDACVVEWNFSGFKKLKLQRQARCLSHFVASSSRKRPALPGEVPLVSRVHLIIFPQSLAQRVRLRRAEAVVQVPAPPFGVPELLRQASDRA